MPELPEVQTIVNDLNQSALIDDVIQKPLIYWNRIVGRPSISEFVQNVQNKKINFIYRRAKFIVITFSQGGALLIHLRMTGKLYLSEKKIKRNKHEHLFLKLKSGREIRYHDTRKFGRWYYYEDPDTKLNMLGIEPLEKKFTHKQFLFLLKKHKKNIKSFLLDQSIVAGLGNIYVDEALWLAKIHPKRKSHTLKENESKRLHQAIRKVLNIGIKNLGTSLGKTDINYYSVSGRRGRNQDALKVFRRTGLPCPRCKKAIERHIIMQRSTHICSSCQK